MKGKFTTFVYELKEEILAEKRACSSCGLFQNCLYV
jgi:hypothetical protein